MNIFSRRNFNPGVICIDPPFMLRVALVASDAVNYFVNYTEYFLC